MRTDAADGGCVGGLDFAPMHALAPSRLAGFPPHATSSQYNGLCAGHS